MRRTSRSALLLATFIVFVYIGCSHLRELTQVLRTYSTFYPHLARHPETLYWYHSSGTYNAETDTTIGLVTPYIHRIFLQEGQTVPMNASATGLTSCQNLHPEWLQLVWTDGNASSFMAAHYPHIWPHYKAYRQTIQRANVLRYALLHHYGGVYLDWDVECLEPLDNLRPLPWLTPGAYPAGVNNAFILSRQFHPFLTHLLQGVAGSDLAWGLPYVENMLSTGCMFFSNMWMSYVRKLADGSLVDSEDAKLFVLADGDGRLETHMLRGAVTTPLFRHGGASSWHEWDAAAIVVAGEHYLLILGVLITLAGGAAYGYTRRRSSGRASEPSRGPWRPARKPSDVEMR